MMRTMRKRTFSFKCTECGEGAMCMITILSTRSHYDPEPFPCLFKIFEAKWVSL